MKKTILLSFLVFTLFACKSKKNIPDVSKIDVDLKLERLFVVHPGKDSYGMNDQTEAVALIHLRTRLAQVSAEGQP